MLELMAPGSAVVRWWYMYGFVGVVYGHGPPTPPPEPDPDKLDPIDPGSIVVLILATEDEAVLKQLIEFWWWLVDTTDPKGFTGHGNVFVPGVEGRNCNFYESELFSELT